jgi:hypothetical protein
MIAVTNAKLKRKAIHSLIKGASTALPPFVTQRLFTYILDGCPSLPFGRHHIISVANLFVEPEDGKDH